MDTENMDKNNKQTELKPINFDDYIVNCLNDFMSLPGHHYIDEDGFKVLNDELSYLWLRDTENRNKSQVPECLWRKILLHHHYHGMYN